MDMSAAAASQRPVGQPITKAGIVYNIHIIQTVKRDQYRHMLDGCIFR